MLPIVFVFIQMFMHVISSPLYTFSTILFAMLLSAGVGSAVSGYLNVTHRSRWPLPFVAVLLTVITTSLLIPFITDSLLGTPVPVRILSTVLVVFPTGLFLGMPFPLGISTFEHKPKGAVAWAWGLNGFFTVVGGLLAVLFSTQWGFTVTLLIACAVYLAARLMFAQIRRGIDAEVQPVRQLSLPATLLR